VVESGSGRRNDAGVPGMGALGVVESGSTAETGPEPVASGGGEPAGGPYEWYRRAMLLLETGNPEAALQLIERLEVVQPGSRSVHEARARALFDARRFEEAALAFESILERTPDDDYAHFGLGLCLWRTQQFVAARDELAMAFVMRPSRPEYGQALAQVKATLAARIRDGLPLNGPVRRGGLE
jgi:predicted Zn-dependent protease